MVRWGGSTHEAAHAPVGGEEYDWCLQGQDSCGPIGITSMSGTAKPAPLSHRGVSLVCLFVCLLVAAAIAEAQTQNDITNFGVLTNATGFVPKSQLVHGPEGTLYGTTYRGEEPLAGTVFKINSDGTGFAIIKQFTNYADGAYPCGSLTLSGNTLYGTTEGGGEFGAGTVFKLNTDGADFAVLHSFTDDESEGSQPRACFILVGNTLYGTTSQGGPVSQGAVFKVNTDGRGYTVLKCFDNLYNDGGFPCAELAVSGNTLYGSATIGGSSSAGMLFKLNTDGTGYTVLKRFGGQDGAAPMATLVLCDTLLYGTTSSGGGSNGGTVFRLNTDGTDYAVIKSLNDSLSEGADPKALILLGDTLYGTTSGGGILDSGTVFRLKTNGSDYAVIKDFGGSDGEFPGAGVTVFGDALYGTTALCGEAGCGAVFKLNTNGADYMVLNRFTGPDGHYPTSGLTLLGDRLYGTTEEGGNQMNGTLFKVATNGADYTVLKHFTDPRIDGETPRGSLLLSGDTIYGTTAMGGTSLRGTVFKVNTDGTGFAVLRHFSNSDGGFPAAGLVLSGDTLYGTTEYGGNWDCGTVFKVNTNGTDHAILVHFDYLTRGAYPTAGLVLSGSMLYGTSRSGGYTGWGTVFKVKTDGSEYAVLKNFSGGSGEGINPHAGLVLSGNVFYGATLRTIFKIHTDGTGFAVLQSFGTETPLIMSSNRIFGTTSYGGTWGAGTLFQMNIDGTGHRVLKDFTFEDGARPAGGLALLGDSLFGVTKRGGALDVGTLFRVDLALNAATTLLAERVRDNMVLKWTGTALSLQAAPVLQGTYTNVPGATSPYTNRMDKSKSFFRLIGN